MFYFMINFKEFLSKKWNNSLVFTRKNATTNNSSTISISQELVNNLEAFLKNNSYYSKNTNAAKFLNTDRNSNNLFSNTVLIFIILIKIILNFLFTIVSAVPSAIFKYTSGSGNTQHTCIDGSSQLPSYANALHSNNNLRGYVYSYLYNNYSNLTQHSSVVDIQVYSLKKKLTLNSNNLSNSVVFKLSDYILINLLVLSYKTNIKYINNFRYMFTLKQIDWNFYNVSSAGSKFKLGVGYFQNYYLIGLKSIWLGVRYWIVGLVLSIIIFFYFLHLKALPFNKTVFGYFVIGWFFYYFISTYVFFVKKYQFNKYTSVIQRFWKRTFIIFWMMEIFLFSIFLFLTLNAAEEPIYMYDQARVYKTHLFSWRWFLVKVLPSVLLIIAGFYLQMTIRWGVFSRQNVLLLAITLLIIYIFWLEFYQFYHILSFYGNFFWNYDYDEFLWTLELDDRRTRLTNNLVAICLIAKFWHVVFLFIFWVFFMLRVNELKRVRYQFMAANIQNFIFLYIMSWAYMYPWFKFLGLKQLSSPYYWFNLSFRRVGLRVFVADIKLHIIALFSGTGALPSFTYIPLYYWHEATNLTNFSGPRKSSIKDHVIGAIHSII